MGSVGPNNKSLQVQRIVTSEELNSTVVEFFASSFDAMLQLYAEAHKKNATNPAERKAQMSIASARLAAMCEAASDFFATAAVEHTGADQDASEAAKAAVGVVTAMVNRKVNQWTAEAEKKVN